MPLDSVFLSGLKKELAPQILGARIDKVQQPERDLLVLSLRTHDGNVRLLVHGGVGSARVHLTEGRFENPASPPMFCMLLRKHLVGARITELVDNGDRLLQIHMDARDEMGVETRRTLVVEMMGRQSNVILVDAEGIILDCMRRVDPSMSEIRPLLKRAPRFCVQQSPARRLTAGCCIRSPVFLRLSAVSSAFVHFRTPARAFQH